MPNLQTFSFNLRNNNPVFSQPRQTVLELRCAKNREHFICWAGKDEWGPHYSFRIETSKYSILYRSWSNKGVLVNGERLPFKGYNEWFHSEQTLNKKLDLIFQSLSDKIH